MSVTPKQMRTLINFMEEHPELAKGYKPNTAQGKNIINQMWGDLGTLLNADGLPTKSVTAWRKVWTDYKYRAKKKCSQNVLSLKKTGGGPHEEIFITEDEEKVIQMTSIRSAVSGSSSNVFGAPPSTKNEIEVDDLESVLRGIVESPQKYSQGDKTAESRKRNSTPSIAATPKRLKENEPNIQDLIKAQLKNDTKFQNNIINYLKERNEQDSIFHSKVIACLERRNEIAQQELRK